MIKKMAKGESMGEPSEDDIKKALAPYHARIRAAIVDGFAEWLAVNECRTAKGFGPVLYPRTITNYVFDAIARQARAVFSKDPTVHVHDESQTVKFCFGQTVIGRFKKGDEDNLGQNIVTQAVLDFIEAQATLPGLPPAAAKVEFVWSADDLGTGIQSVMVVARDGDQLLWAYEIEAETGGDIVPLPPRVDPDDDLPLVAPKVKKPDEDAKGE